MYYHSSSVDVEAKGFVFYMTWDSYVSDVCQCLFDRISQVEPCELFGVHTSLNRVRMYR